MALGLGRRFFGALPRRLPSQHRACAGGAAPAALGQAAASQQEAWQVRLNSSLEDRIHRSKHRPRDEIASLRQSQSYQKIKNTRLHQPLAEEQRKILRALRQSANVLDWEGAMTVLATIPENPGPEWLPVYRSVLSICCKAMRPEEAKEIFWKRLPQRDIMSYNMMLGLLARLRLDAEVEEMLKQMEADGVEKSGVTYVSIIQSHQEASRWEAAISSLHELKGKPELDDSTSWAAAYLAAMSACARSGRRGETRALLDELRTRGYLEGNHWNTLIVACGCDAAAAKQVFADMRAEGFPPRISDWKALLGTHRDIGEQRRVYQEAAAEMPQGAPLAELWAVLLRTALGQEDFEAVDWVHQTMREHGVDPRSEEADATPSLKRALRWARILASKARKRAAEEKAALARPAPAEGPLPLGWSAAVDPASGRQYFWQDSDPAGTTTWTPPMTTAAAQAPPAPGAPAAHPTAAAA